MKTAPHRDRTKQSQKHIPIIYEGEEALQNISLYASYFLNSHWFLSGELSKGMSDTAVDFSGTVSVGYYF